MTDIQNSKLLEILVIDDDPKSRELLEDLIIAKGLNVTTAVDGQEGIKKHIERFSVGNPYDAVFTDFKMPNADGAEVTKNVKGTSLKTPVYIFTSHDADELSKELDVQLGQLKPDGIIRKPLDINLIRNIIDEIKLGVVKAENTPTYQS